MCNPNESQQLVEVHVRIHDIHVYITDIQYSYTSQKGMVETLPFDTFRFTYIYDNAVFSWK